jgi:hypothetical protein
MVSETKAGSSPAMRVPRSWRLRRMPDEFDWAG